MRDAGADESKRSQHTHPRDTWNSDRRHRLLLPPTESASAKSERTGPGEGRQTDPARAGTATGKRARGSKAPLTGDRTPAPRTQQEGSDPAPDPYARRPGPGDRRRLRRDPAHGRTRRCVRAWRWWRLSCRTGYNAIQWDLRSDAGFLVQNAEPSQAGDGNWPRLLP